MWMNFLADSQPGSASCFVKAAVQVTELLAEHPLKRLASSVPGFGEYISVLANCSGTLQENTRQALGHYSRVF
jgi:hypothetical protein